MQRHVFLFVLAISFGCSRIYIWDHLGHGPFGDTITGEEVEAAGKQIDLQKLLALMVSCHVFRTHG